ncbi:MAG: hypothetical protein M3Y87_23505 [Myxococcota bacterium]|nr:hypothetical protein [Myxococcota bacterium]
MDIRKNVVALLCAGALTFAIAGCDEPNERNAIGPEDFDQAGSLDQQLPVETEAEQYDTETEAGIAPAQPAEWGDVGEERTGAFTYEE